MSVGAATEAAGFPLPPPSPDRPPIKVLPVGVSARIAAGETIERPASVVKELVENAIDAGAKGVRVDVRGGGLGLIRVGDDGCGMRAADLWLACQRHATSKFPVGGLAAVRTLGFRGEALPSIAAVAELAIVSAPDDRGLGWKLTLRDGAVVAQDLHRAEYAQLPDHRPHSDRRRDDLEGRAYTGTMAPCASIPALSYASVGGDGSGRPPRCHPVLRKG